jgi:hypothetical protein
VHYVIVHETSLPFPSVVREHQCELRLTPRQDATLQLVVNDTYVAVAVGRDDQDAAPQRGSFKGEEGSEPPRVNLQIMRQQ